jgi:hypothetical protein
MRRSRGRIALAIVFALLALNAWAQVVLVPLGRVNDPPALVALQTLVGATGAAAAWGSWTGARWATAAALLYGVATAGLLAALTPILGLPADARGGLLRAAAGVLVFAAAAAWYLRRERRRAASA